MNDETTETSRSQGLITLYSPEERNRQLYMGLYDRRLVSCNAIFQHGWSADFNYSHGNIYFPQQLQREFGCLFVGRALLEDKHLNRWCLILRTEVS